MVVKNIGVRTGRVAQVKEHLLSKHEALPKTNGSQKDKSQACYALRCYLL
jgi:hypothetical protein